MTLQSEAGETPRGFITTSYADALERESNPGVAESQRYYPGRLDELSGAISQQVKTEGGRILF